MSETDVLQRVRSRGYWRIVARPTTYRERLTSPAECERIVAQSAVRLRGWEYPAVLNGSPHVRRKNFADGYGQELDFGNDIEVWKMSLSGQFVHNLALLEDWFPEVVREGPLREVEPMTRFSFVDAIYTATEIFEFLARVARSGLYEEALEVTVELHGLKGRVVWLHGKGRLPIVHEYRTSADEFTWNRTVNIAELLERPRELSAMLLVRIFAIFGWDISVDRLTSEVEDVISGRYA